MTIMRTQSSTTPTAEFAIPSNSALTMAYHVIAEQQRRIRELENETQTDMLTGLLNRRGFQRILERERDRALRNGYASAILVLFDLDGLKRINDAYGHQAGDSYISGLAQGLKTLVRSTDHVARLGGDEFALLLTDITPDAGLQKAEAIVERLNKYIIEHSGKYFTLRVSHGSIAITPGESVEVLINQADSKLYLQKAIRKSGLLSHGTIN